WTRHRLALVLAAVDIFDRQCLGPILPIAVADNDGDRRTDRLRVTHTGDNFGAVGLDLHAPAAAIALLAPPQLPVYRIDGNRYAGGESLKRGREAFAMGFPRRLESEHRIRRFIVTFWNRAPPFGVFSSDGETAALAAPAGVLLAVSAGGARALSAGVVAVIAVPRRRNR